MLYRDMLLRVQIKVQAKHYWLSNATSEASYQIYQGTSIRTSASSLSSEPRRPNFVSWTCGFFVLWMALSSLDTSSSLQGEIKE